MAVDAVGSGEKRLKGSRNVFSVNSFRAYSVKVESARGDF